MSNTYNYTNPFALESQGATPSEAHPTLETREYTLPELIAIRKKGIESWNNYTYEAKKCQDILSNIPITMKDLQEHTPLHDEFQRTSDECKQLQHDITLCKTAVDGIEGAIRYYLATQLQQNLPKIMTKFSGKSAGPKTLEKFRDALEESTGIKGIRCNLSHNYYIDFYMAHIGNDQVVYLSNNLIDGNNKFIQRTAEEYRDMVCVPKDAFSGNYPVDWIDWAQKVYDANRDIEAAFTEFVAKQDKLIHSLKIGNTTMKRVHKHYMKEER